jgi:natural product biosynthesis luciferase-like monooxygenase protein
MKLSLFFLPTYRPRIHGSEGRLYEEIFEEVDLAERAGFDRVWFAEHHFFAYGGAQSSAAMFGLAAAARTRRIRVGSGVALLPLNDPIRVAEEFALLDVLSGGRLDFGIGRAFQRAEYEAFNVPMEESRARFEEANEIIMRAWSGETFSYDGRFRRLRNVTVMPRPLQRPHPPVFVACVISEESFRFTGRHGYNLMYVPYVSDQAHGAQRMGWYREALAEAGIDPRTREILLPYHFYCGENPDEAREFPRPYLADYLEAAAEANRSDADASQYSGYQGIGQGFAALAKNYESMYPNQVIFGDASQCLERMAEVAEFGATEVSLVTNFGAMPHAAIMRSMERFARDVMPHLRRS